MRKQTAEIDAQLQGLERALGRRLRKTLRARVWRQLAHVSEAWERARRDRAVPDQTDPGFAVRAAPVESQARGGRRG